MNIVIIPSWYITKDNPSSGIFFREQAILFAKQNPDINLHIVYVHKKKFYLSNNPFMYTDDAPVNFVEHLKTRNIFLPTSIFGSKLSKKFIVLRDVFTRSIYKSILHEINKKYGALSLIHAHGMYPAGDIARCLSEKFKLSYIVQEHMSEKFMHSLPISTDNQLNALAKKILNNASAVYAVSRSLATKLQIVVSSQVNIMPNFIDDSLFSISPNYVKNEFTFLTVCNLIPRKRIDILIRAFAIIVNELKLPVKLLIVGSGPELNSLLQLSSSFGLLNHIEFYGAANQVEVNQLIRESNCFVLTSNNETFGVVYIEAIASGRPIIATKCGGPEDIVSDINGYLVDIDDINNIAIAMNNIVHNIKQYKPEDIRLDYENRLGAAMIINNLRTEYLKYA